MSNVNVTAADEINNGEDDDYLEYKKLYGPDFDYDRYDEDKDYRLSIGPSIPLWGESGSIESLVGLSWEWNFPNVQTNNNNKCSTIVKARVGMTEDNGWMDKTRNVYWKFDNLDKEFLLPMEEEDLLECYFMTRPKEEIPSWFDYEHKFASPLFDIQPHIKLSNFHLPHYAIEEFKCVEEEQDRWDTTMSCLNDPNNARYYDPDGERYPLSFLLTLIVISKGLDSSTKLPMMRKDSVEATKVQKLVDIFTANISTHGTATRQLLRICNDLKKMSTAFAKNKDPTLEETKEVLVFVEAIILTMSTEYEDHYTHDNWYSTSDLDGVYQCTYELVMGIGRVLLHEKAIDGIKVMENGKIIATHLKSGAFVQFVSEDSDSLKECCEGDEDVMKMWTDILNFAEYLKQAE